MKRTDRDWVEDAASHLEIVSTHLRATADSPDVLRTILEKGVAAFDAQVAQLRTAAEDVEGTS